MIMSCLRRFRRDEDGAVMTMEAILWFPLMFFILVAVCDLSIFYMNKARIDQILSAGVRGHAVGALAECGATKVWLETEVRVIAPNAVASCSESGPIATAVVSYPASDVTLTGDKGLLRAMQMNASRMHLNERL